MQKATTNKQQQPDATGKHSDREPQRYTSNSGTIMRNVFETGEKKIVFKR